MNESKNINALISEDDFPSFFDFTPPSSQPKLSPLPASQATAVRTSPASSPSSVLSTVNAIGGASLVKVPTPVLSTHFQPKAKRPSEPSPEAKQRKMVKTDSLSSDLQTLRELVRRMRRYSRVGRCFRGSCVLCTAGPLARFPRLIHSRCLVDRRCLRCLSSAHTSTDCSIRVHVPKEFGSCYQCLGPSDVKQHVNVDNQQCASGPGCDSVLRDKVIPACFLVFRTGCLMEQTDCPAHLVPADDEHGFAAWLCMRPMGSNLLNAIHLASWLAKRSL